VIFLKKCELLAPAGDMESLRQAIINGADAVYVACKNFGARKFATNFTNETIVEAIKLCHLYGVKIYVTMNTLVKNEEVESFIEQAYFLHKNGVDALIVQDFGMICLLREKYPNLEIHASTQANTSSRDTCKLFYDLGVKRVVFSRELSIDEIDSIDVPIEKEAFIHGALCISYSGCCLMSSMLGGRSGNRGECAGCCRMPFTLEKNNEKISSEKYLLSTKELNTSNYIERLKNSSIYSFKIEGRMKSPLYVGFITRLYRKLIDSEDINLEEEIDKLKTIFNREFTKGRIFDESDSNLMNIKSPNHVGLRIGKVIDVNSKKIKIKLDKGRTLNQYDAIRFFNSKKGLILNFLYDSKMNLTNSSSDICFVDNKVGLEINDVVTKTQDYLLNKEFLEDSFKKIPVKFRVEAKVGKKLAIEISDGANSIKREFMVVDKAINAPTSLESIIKQLNKLGNTPFVCSDVEAFIDDNIFIQIRELNEARRILVDELISIRENQKKNVIENNVLFDRLDNCREEPLEKVGISCFVFNSKQLDSCLKLGVKNIYLKNRELYSKYKDNKNIYLVIDRCNYNISKDLVNYSFVSDYIDFNNKNIRANYSLNVTNVYTAYYLRKIGLKTIPLSVELNEDEIIDFIKIFNNKFGDCSFEILAYGRVENMIIKGNILSLYENDYSYKLIDFKERKFPVYYDGINTHILNYEYRNIDISKIKDKCVLRLDFYDEDNYLLEKIVKEHQ
jgi:putative protease